MAEAEVAALAARVQEHDRRLAEHDGRLKEVERMAGGFDAMREDIRKLEAIAERIGDRLDSLSRSLSRWAGIGVALFGAAQLAVAIASVLK